MIDIPAYFPFDNGSPAAPPWVNLPRPTWRRFDMVVDRGSMVERPMGGTIVLRHSGYGWLAFALSFLLRWIVMNFFDERMDGLDVHGDDWTGFDDVIG